MLKNLIKALEKNGFKIKIKKVARAKPEKGLNFI